MDSLPQADWLRDIDAAALWAREMVAGQEWPSLEAELASVALSEPDDIERVMKGARIGEMMSRIESLIRNELAVRDPCDPFAAAFAAAACERHAGDAMEAAHAMAGSLWRAENPIGHFVSAAHARTYWAGLSNISVEMREGEANYADSFVASVRAAKGMAMARVDRSALLGALSRAARLDEGAGIEAGSERARANRVARWIVALGGSLDTAGDDMAEQAYWSAKACSGLAWREGVLGDSEDVERVWRRIEAALGGTGFGGSLARWMGGAPAGPIFFVKIGETLKGASVEAYGYKRCVGAPMMLMAKGMLGQAPAEDVVAALEGQGASVCLAALGMSGVEPFVEILAPRMSEYVELSDCKGAREAFGAWRAELESAQLVEAIGDGESGRRASGRL